MRSDPSEISPDAHIPLGDDFAKKGKEYCVAREAAEAAPASSAATEVVRNDNDEDVADASLSHPPEKAEGDPGNTIKRWAKVAFKARVLFGIAQRNDVIDVIEAKIAALKGHCVSRLVRPGARAVRRSSRQRCCQG